MNQSAKHVINLPIVGMICLLFFVGYLILSTGTQTLHCRLTEAQPVQCTRVQTVFFGQIPYSTRPFTVQQVEVASELTDRTPRGGVRFHHTLTLSGPQGKFVADLLQSPVSGASIKKQVEDFLAGNGDPALSFQAVRSQLAILRTGLMALLLSIVTWGFWDVRWPRPAQPQSSLMPSEELLQ